MRMRIGMAAAILAGTLLVYCGSEIRAEPKPRVTSLVQGREDATGRTVLILVGNGVGKVRSFELRNGDGEPVGAAEELAKSSKVVSIRLPEGVGPGAYTLVMQYGRDKESPVAFTVPDPRLIVGVHGEGSIPASGLGTRFMFHAGKSALRAGRADDDPATAFDESTAWDDENVGDYSVAVGRGTTASGNHAFAAGRSTTAGGSHSTALGRGTTAGGDRSTAMGDATVASGSTSTALGRDTLASGDDSTALGIGTTASGDSSTAMGDATVASGSTSTALGRDTLASGDDSTALGRNTNASGFGSTALGDSTKATGNGSTATGRVTTASGFGATAMGDTTTASGSNSTSLCRLTTASGNQSIAMGHTTTASGDDSTAMGRDTESRAYASLALGRGNTASGNETSWVATDPLLVAGNGTSSVRSDAMVLFKNGNLWIAGSLTEASDARLKTDIRPLTGVVESLLRIRGVSYEFKDTERHPEGRRIGVLAQEVREVFPELVTVSPDGHLAVSYSDLTAVLLEAVKEQQTRIEGLEARLGEIERRLADR